MRVERVPVARAERPQAAQHSPLSPHHEGTDMERTECQGVHRMTQLKSFKIK